MTTFQGICLGVLQGIAEFLPISSSGHLQVAQKLFGLEEVPLLFDVFLHLATLAAVILYFRKTIAKLFCILFRWVTRKEEPVSEEVVSGKIATLAPNDKAGRNTILMILLSTIVTGAIGVVTAKIVPDVSLKIVCIGFEITAILLIISSIIERKRAAKLIEAGENANLAGKKSGINWKQALIIGFAQGIGTLPGISRSGSTIAGAQFCGVDRVTAGDYSFVVSIPAILGAFLLEIKDLGNVTSTIGVAPVVAGCAAAFASGFLALTWLMKLIHKGKLEWFAAYLIPLGIMGIICF